MRVGGPAAGAFLAGICGVFTAYTAFQPALKEEAEKRAGTFQENPHEENKEKLLSNAIISDLKEAKHEVTSNYETGGFAWGIRKALFGPKPAQNDTGSSSAATRSEKDR